MFLNRALSLNRYSKVSTSLLKSSNEYFKLRKGFGARDLAHGSSINVNFENYDQAVNHIIPLII